MKKLILAVIVLSIGYLAMAKAEEIKSVTPKEFVEAVASVPGKVALWLEDESKGKDFGSVEEDTIALEVKGPDGNTEFFYIPGCASMPDWLKDRIDNSKEETVEVKEIEENINEAIKSLDIPQKDQKASSEKKRFYSPLVKSIAKKENISNEQLDSIKGSGKEGRVTKADILNYLKRGSNISVDLKSNIEGSVTNELGDQIIEMDRMSKIIFDHMSESKKISAHVQSFVEADVTNLWDWREKNKLNFLKNENEKLTFTPLFIFSVIKALRDFPILNSSVENEKIVVKKSINIGMATSLDNGNLIVPVIKNADHLNLKGLAIAVNDLSNRARNNTLRPDEISDGTYTVTNVGNFGSIMGTPIINQPQVGILAIGVIRKIPSVIETPNGDFIGIRKKLILSHSYDHRIINGSVGSSFVKRVAEYLEKWDIAQTI